MRACNENGQLSMTHCLGRRTCYVARQQHQQPACSRQTRSIIGWARASHRTVGKTVTMQKFIFGGNLFCVYLPFGGNLFFGEIFFFGGGGIYFGKKFILGGNLFWGKFILCLSPIPFVPFFLSSPFLRFFLLFPPPRSGPSNPAKRFEGALLDSSSGGNDISSHHTWPMGSVRYTPKCVYGQAPTATHFLVYLEPSEHVRCLQMSSYFC